MSDNRLPEELRLGQFQQGKRSHGNLKKRFKDKLKSSLRAFNIDYEKAVRNRAGWQSAVHGGAATKESGVNCHCCATQNSEESKCQEIIGYRHDPLSILPEDFSGMNSLDQPPGNSSLLPE